MSEYAVSHAGCSWRVLWFGSVHGPERSQLGNCEHCVHGMTLNLQFSEHFQTSALNTRAQTQVGM